MQLLQKQAMLLGCCCMNAYQSSFEHDLRRKLLCYGVKEQSQTSSWICDCFEKPAVTFSPCRLISASNSGAPSCLAG